MKTPLLPLLLLTAGALPAEELTVTPVTAGIHMINGRGGNIGVCAGDDGLLLIDAKFARLAEPMRAALAGLGEGDPAFLLNTHHHGDHTGGNAVFGAVTPILAHHNVRARLLAGEAPPPESLPVLTFEEGVSLHFNGEEIDVVHFPAAHTDGDAVVFFTGSDVVHMGDILFHGRFPYVDIDAGGSVDGVIAAVEAVLARIGPETRVIPGHGELAAPGDLRTYLRMIRETRAAVEDGMAAGLGLEELQAAGVAEEWASWSWGFISAERWIATLHRGAGG